MGANSLLGHAQNQISFVNMHFQFNIGYIHLVIVIKSLISMDHDQFSPLYTMLVYTVLEFTCYTVFVRKSKYSS